MLIHSGGGLVPFSAVLVVVVVVVVVVIQVRLYFRSFDCVMGEKSIRL